MIKHNHPSTTHPQPINTPSSATPASHRPPLLLADRQAGGHGRGGFILVIETICGHDIGNILIKHQI